ncbi:MAG: hypothetical protein KCHDKBKB_02728 [Elusimicrobia bacterium]|nr:hypothetical protein [Elusimicrobiota bacterium]
MKNHYRTEGFTLTEAIIASAILLVVLTVFLGQFNLVNTQTRHVEMKAFAVQKAAQLIEELRGAVVTTPDLESYDDQGNDNLILTTLAGVTTHDHNLSGNERRLYARRIQVDTVPNDPSLRRISVQVFKRSDHSLLAEAMNILRITDDGRVDSPSSEVFHIYAIAIQNIPSIKESMADIKTSFQTAIQDLQNRNPGLQFRISWITRTAYGRDPFYAPYINRAKRTDQEAPPWVYFYPGKTRTASNDDTTYYDPNEFGGRINVDGTIQNPNSYSLADQFNHALRYPDEIERFDQAVAAADAAGEPRPEISLVQLMEDLIPGDPSPSGVSNNSIIVNLHSELTPFPPLRYYSDAAKDPVNLPNIRVVTHPEYLGMTPGQATYLRVYPYAIDPENFPTNTVIPTVTIRLNKHVQFTAANAGDLQIRKVNGAPLPAYAWQVANPTDFDVIYPDANTTLIKLYNLPVRHPYMAGSQTGLSSNQRAYGLEYIPSPLGCHNDCGSFDQIDGMLEGTADLTTVGDVQKNTARVRIILRNLPFSTLNVETWIGDTDTPPNAPITNYSRTYVYTVGSIPRTELFQHMGDPIFSPYIWPGDQNNICFPGWSPNGGADVSHEYIPQLLAMYMWTIYPTSNLYTNLMGQNHFYYGLGGEFGATDSRFTNGLPFKTEPWVPDASNVAWVDEIRGLADLVPSPTQIASPKHIVRYTGVNNTTDWTALSWIGELYPDNQYDIWSDPAGGNLMTTANTTNPGRDKFFRAPMNLPVQTPGTPDFSFPLSPNLSRKLEREGMNLFMNTANDLEHVPVASVPNGTTVDLTEGAQDLAQSFNFTLDPSPFASVPYIVNSMGGGAQQSWGEIDIYYGTNVGGSRGASALFHSRDPAGAWGPGFLLINGFQAADLYEQIRFGLAATVRGIIMASLVGNKSGPFSAGPLPPYLRITQPAANARIPSGTTSLTIAWTTEGKRWGGQPYATKHTTYDTGGLGLGYVTNTLPSNVAGSGSLTQIKYSRDGGQTWFLANSNQPAVSGRPYLVSVGSPFTWNLNGLPAGNYLIRVESFAHPTALATLGNATELSYGYYERWITIQN